MIGLLLGLALASAPELAAVPEQAATEDDATSLGPPLFDPVTDEALLDARTYKVSSILRCPVCQGLSVADSTADAAVAMKSRVRELVAAGYSDEQILDFFAERYGDFILLAPPKEGLNWFLWAAPLIIIAAGGLWLLVGRREGTPAPEPQTKPEEDDDPYRARILAELED